MSHDADVLNRLIGRLRNAAAAYRKAGADGVVEPEEVFDDNAAAHDRTADTLDAAVRALGERPAEPGRFDLSHHAWSELPAALPQGARAVAQAVERVEAELLSAFQAAMDDPGTSGPVRDVVVRAFDGVKAGHDAALQRLDAVEAS